MDFYTSVCRTRDKILVKGYKGNKQEKLAVSYRAVPSVLLNLARISLNDKSISWAAVNVEAF